MTHLALLLLLPTALPQDSAPVPGPSTVEGLLFVEVPDLPALLKAYEKAPLVQMVGDASVRDSVTLLLESAGIEVAPAVQRALEGLGLPEGMAAAPLEAARGMLDQVRSARLQLSLAGEPGQLGAALARSAETIAQLEHLGKKVAEFTQSHQGFPPGSLDELELPEELRRDPWGNPYELEVDLGTLAADLRSLGADGSPGGEGFDADLSLAGDKARTIERLLEHTFELVCEVDFADAEIAGAAWQQAQELVGNVGWVAGEERDVKLSSKPARVCSLSDPAEPQRAVWMLAQDSRLMVAYGHGSLERTLERRQSETRAGDAGAEVSALARHLDPPSGAIVVRGWTQLGRLDGLLAEIEQAVESSSDLNIERLPVSGDGVFRMQLAGDRFVTETISTTTPNPAAGDEPDFLGCFGAAPVPASLWKFVPDDAIGVLATALDGQALYAEVLKALGAQPGERPKVLQELEARHGFSLDQEVIKNLGDGAAVYLLPITGVISIPGVAVVVELRDAKAFQSGLDGVLRLLEEQAGGEFSVRYKPYRDQPLWTFTFGGNQGGGLGMAGPLTVSPSLAIVENHLLVTLTSLRAKKEIKRVLEGEGGLHRLLAGDAAPPSGATTVGYMDWPAFLGGTYEGARSALALFAGMADDLPFDPEALPSGDTFTRFFRPTTLWSTKPEAGVRKTRLESSFGPETWLGLLAGGGAMALGVQSSGTLHGSAHAYEVEVSEVDPEVQAAIDGSEATLAEVATRLEVFRIENGRYPRALSELLQPTPNYPRGYLDRDGPPVDGWGRELVYLPASDGSAYSLWSLGEDGVDERGNGDDVRVP